MEGFDGFLRVHSAARMVMVAGLYHPREVFFRSANHTYRFKLNKRVTEPLGMAKGDPKGDLALYAVMMPRGWFSFTPRTLEWAILNWKDAERIE